MIRVTAPAFVSNGDHGYHARRGPCLNAMHMHNLWAS